VLAYFFVLSIGGAMWITGKPRVAVRTFAVPHEDVTLQTPDRVRLAAWYVPRGIELRSCWCTAAAATATA
jgi:hypothetical protein